MFSGRILDLKDGKENAIQYFYDILDREDLLDFYNEVKQENSCKQMSLFDVM